MVSSSIFENNNSALPTWCPDGNNTSFVAISFQEFSIRFDDVESLELTLRMLLSFEAVNGKNGSQTVAKAAAICKATNIIVCVRLASSLITFQGSSSAKY